MFLNLNNIFSSQMLIISYSANQISQTGKGEFETLYKTVDKYLKFDKQQKGSLKHYTKPLINISNLTNRKRGDGNIILNR